MTRPSFEVYDGDGQPPLPIRKVKAFQCLTQDDPNQPGQTDIYLEVPADQAVEVNKFWTQEVRLTVEHVETGINFFCGDVEILRIPRKVQEGFWPNAKIHKDGYQFVIPVKAVK